MRTLAILGLVAMLAAGCVAAPASSTSPVPPNGATRIVSPSPTLPTTTSAALSGVPSPSAATDVWSPQPVPTVAGRDLYTVSRAIRERDAGTLGGKTIALGGYWSASGAARSCPAPDHQVSDLEVYCQESAFGITEDDEAITTIVSNGMMSTTVGATGPHLTPLVPDSLQDRIAPFTPRAPVPLVVTGHFDDPRAAACVANARQTCRDRFVIETILAFDPAAAPTPTPTPLPTPFPSPAPSGLFDAAQCAGDVGYSFVGWTTSDALNSNIPSFTGHAWAVVTRGIVPIGTWGEDPNYPGHYNLPFGRRVCVGFELEPPGGIAFGVVQGTAYRLWDDGQRTRDDEGPGSADPTLPAPGSFPPTPKAVPVTMRGPGLAAASMAIRDWSGGLVSARPASEADLAPPSSATVADTSTAAAVLPDAPRSVLVVWAECGSDRSGTLIVTKDRQTVLVVAAGRTDCGQPGARRGAVLTFGSALPPTITAVGGLMAP